MCGRAVNRMAPAAVTRTVRAAKFVNSDAYRPSPNVMPGRFMPVLLHTAEDGRVLHAMKWGLIPSWTSKKEEIGYDAIMRTMNARSESVEEKNTFRNLIHSKRCAVVVEGFIEWLKDEGPGPAVKPVPYFLTPKSAPCLVFAGLYDVWTNADGEMLESFTILTTSVVEELKWLHDRMPVLLQTDADIDRWINCEVNSFDSVRDLLVPVAGALQWYAVSKEINSGQNENESVLERQPENKSKAITSFFTPMKKVKTEVKQESSPTKREASQSDSSTSSPAKKIKVEVEHVNDLTK